MKEEINKYNSKGQYHGYNEWYNVDGSLRIRTNWKNGRVFGYFEYHAHKQTNYYIR